MLARAGLQLAQSPKSDRDATRVDTIIVGAGTAGLTALCEVRRFTEDFLTVDGGRWGASCASVGCMRSKALIDVANAFHRRYAFDDVGIRGADLLRADIPAALAHVRELRDGFVAGPQSVREKLGPRAISARARLKGPNRIEVNGEEIEARAEISRPTRFWPRSDGGRISTTWVLRPWASRLTPTVCPRSIRQPCGSGIRWFFWRATPAATVP